MTRFGEVAGAGEAGATLKHGGLLLTNDRLPEVRGGSMRQAGLTDVQYNRDAVGWYQKR